MSLQGSRESVRQGLKSTGRYALFSRGQPKPCLACKEENFHFIHTIPEKGKE